MRIVRSVAGMQRWARSWRRAGIRVGFVPTMGFLHAGHLSLVREARRRVGAGGKVVLSIYVNPTQFGPKEDFSKYPRDLARDSRLCREAGVDLLFVPSDVELYPQGREDAFSTFVEESALSSGWEGRTRPTHFRGVTTIVAKLFNLVLPEVAVFGAKDWQQAAVVRRMVRDLNFPVRVMVAPTVRESDGLALSSRNKYLSAAERSQALVLWQAIRAARAAVLKSRQPLSAVRLRKTLSRTIARQPSARVDYIAFFDSETLQAVAKVSAGNHLALAVYVGRTRLIDNARL